MTRPPAEAGAEGPRRRRWTGAVRRWRRWRTSPSTSRWRRGGRPLRRSGTLRAQRHVVLLQSLDQRYYHDDEPADRLGAAAVLDLPVGFVAVSSHLARTVSALRPEASVHHVAPGIDKAVFAPVPPRSGPGPLRVLVEGQPSLWFKGVADAVAAVGGCASRPPVTVVAADPAAAGEVGADRVCGGLCAGRDGRRCTPSTTFCSSCRASRAWGFRCSRPSTSGAPRCSRRSAAPTASPGTG